MRTRYYIPLLLIVAACNSKPKPVSNKVADTLSNSVETGQDAIQDIDSANYSRYYNELYAYRVDYPKNLLNPQREAGNGDGRAFTDNKGNTILTVYGSKLDTLSARYQQDLERVKATKPNRIIYQELTPDFSVISGFKGDTIFYYKRITTYDGLASIIMEYPKLDSVKYKTVVNAISMSLKKLKVNFY